MNAPLNVISNKPAVELDPRTYKRALSCVHCGLCLPACPTYTTNQHEADSPRGRIQLMRGLADGLIQPTDSVVKHLELCLDCRACETACPSGVVYHELIEETRARLAEQKKLSLQERMMRTIFFHIFVKRKRLKWMLLPPRLMQKAGVYNLLRKSGMFKLLPSQLRKMEQMLPADGRIWPKELPERVEAKGTKKATVAFFAGCIGSVMFDEVNRKAVELLSACGAEVLTPRSQVCCGAIHHHNAAEHPAQGLARQNIDTFVPENGAAVDYIVTDIAGCGAALREYDFLLRDDAKYAARSKVFAGKVRDISEVIAALGLPEMKHRVELTITYHDACHLAHAQRVTAEPRALLASVPGLKMVPLPESDMCCGAAGTYNLTQPEMSMKLAERKLDAIGTTGASVCATGNVGCAMQIQSEADARGKKLKVVHPVEIWHQAVFGANV
ncbi:MAG TPA: (Fe-S)-binding protein [Tepidisphaeraceae bacterium]|jgi:glycolate oxidase iron-sulfur subunit